MTSSRLLPGFLCTLALVYTGFVREAPAQDGAEGAQHEIADTARAFAAAFERGDAAALAEFWLPDGDLVDLSGRHLRGREAIASDFADLFAENPGLTLRIEIASIRVVTPDMAIEDGATSVLPPGGGLPNRARYTNVLVRRDGRWQLASVRESPYAPPSHYEHLRSLEWMIGEWVQEREDAGPVARVTFEWAPDRNFILVTRTIAVGDALLSHGSERIGWDPAARQIRTWTFEVDGGFGEGAWTRDGSTWTARMSSVLSSGSLMTSTTTMTRVDTETVTWQATEQVLDGSPLPDSTLLTMRRLH